MLSCPSLAAPGPGRCQAWPAGAHCARKVERQPRAQQRKREQACHADRAPDPEPARSGRSGGVPGLPALRHRCRPGACVHVPEQRWALRRPQVGEQAAGGGTHAVVIWASLYWLLKHRYSARAGLSARARIGYTCQPRAGQQPKARAAVSRQQGRERQVRTALLAGEGNEGCRRSRGRRWRCCPWRRRRRGQEGARPLSRASRAGHPALAGATAQHTPLRQQAGSEHRGALAALAALYREAALPRRPLQARTGASRALCSDNGYLARAG